jgi:metal-responsive CopG/Arc/MetJ family transcriptional regulator
MAREITMPKTIHAQRVIFTLPPDLLRAADQASRNLSLSRSQLIRLALERFLAEQQRSRLHTVLAEAYQEYAHSSEAIAEEFFASEQEAWDQYAPWEAN